MLILEPFQNSDRVSGGRERQGQCFSDQHSLSLILSGKRLSDELKASFPLSLFQVRFSGLQQIFDNLCNLLSNFLISLLNLQFINFYNGE